MSISFTERIGGRFLDAGGFGVNVTHPDIGAAGDGETDDSAVFGGLQPGHYLVPAGEYRIARNTTVGRGAYLVLASGATFVMDGRTRLRLDGGFDAGPYRIFRGGSVEFGRAVVRDVLPQWWGAIGDGRTDDTAALRAAMGAARTIRLLPGNYAVNDTIVVGSSTYLVGETFARANAGGSTISVHPDHRDGWPDGKPILALSSAPDASECGVSGLKVIGWTDYHRDRSAAAGPVAIDCQNAKNSCMIEHVGIEQCRTGVLNRPDSRWVITLRNLQITKCLEAFDWTCNNGKLYDVSARHNRSLGRILGGQNALYGCHFESESPTATLRLSGRVLLSGCWLEANMHHFEAADRLNLTVASCHFGATLRSGDPSYEHGMALIDGRDIRILVAGSFIRSSRMGWIYRVSSRAADVRVRHVNVDYDERINRFYWDGTRDYDPTREATPPAVVHRETEP